MGALGDAVPLPALCFTPDAATGSTDGCLAAIHSEVERQGGVLFGPQGGREDTKAIPEPRLGHLAPVLGMGRVVSNGSWAL